MSTRSYLRYRQRSALGLIASPNCNVVATRSGRLAVSGGAEHVLVWNIRQGTIAASLVEGDSRDGPLPEVCVLAIGPSEANVAAGYTDGSVRVWDIRKKALVATLHGHRRAVTALAFDATGTFLASGARDTTVVVWDLPAQAGLCRLRGHRDEVTAIAFAPKAAAAAGAGWAVGRGGLGAGAGAGIEAPWSALRLITGGKDTTLRVWDLGTQHCVQTVLGHRSEVWGLTVVPSPAFQDGAPDEGEEEDDGVDVAAAAAAAGAADGDDDDADDDDDAEGGDGDTGAAGAAPVSARRRKRGRDQRASARASTRASRGLPSAVAPWRVATASSDGFVRVFALQTDEAARAGVRAGEGVGKRARDDADAADAEADVAADAEADAAALAQPQHLLPLGGVARQATDRALGVATSADRRYVLVYSGGKVAELYRVRDAESVRHRMHRRQRRAREKAARARAARQDALLDAGAAAGSEEPEPARQAGPIAVDELELVALVRVPKRIRGAAIVPRLKGAAAGDEGAAEDVGVSVLVSLADNSIEVHSASGAASQLAHLPDGSTVPTTRSVTRLAIPGHRGDVRASCLSPDGTLALTVCSGQGKVWNTVTGQAMRTLACGSALCCALAPGNRHALVGTKEGAVQVFDLSSGDMIEEHAEAHEGAVWSLDLRPDGAGMATASADKSVKFWEFDVRQDDAGRRQLTLIHSRTLKVGDEALCVRYSHSRDATRLLVAVSLLDCTVKVFFDDSLKFFLSLYGHRLPVMDMDISSDSTLIVTASADKNVKIWGLDFGDCHRSLFAHSDSIMAIRFVPGTHLFFTASKDGHVKHWDADHFLEIHTLFGHAGEVWTLALSADGSKMVTGSHDRSARVWERTDELVFPEEEREREMERKMNNELRAGGQDEAGGAGEEEGEDEAARPGAPARIVAPESAAVVTRSAESLQGTDRLLEALRLARDVRSEWREFERDLGSALADLSPSERAERLEKMRLGQSVSTLTGMPCPRPELLKSTPSMYILRVLRGMRPADLEPALMMLPFTATVELLGHLHHLIERGLALSVTIRAALFLTRAVGPQLSAAHAAQPTLRRLAAATKERVRAIRDVVGFNVAGIEFLDRLVAQELPGTDLGAAAAASAAAGGGAAAGGDGGGILGDATGAAAAAAASALARREAAPKAVRAGRRAAVQML